MRFLKILIVLFFVSQTKAITNEIQVEKFLNFAKIKNEEDRKLYGDFITVYFSDSNSKAEKQNVEKKLITAVYADIHRHYPHMYWLSASNRYFKEKDISYYFTNLGLEYFKRNKNSSNYIAFVTDKYFYLKEVSNLKNACEYITAVYNEIDDSNPNNELLRFYYKLADCANNTDENISFLLKAKGLLPHPNITKKTNEKSIIFKKIMSAYYENGDYDFTEKYADSIINIKNIKKISSFNYAKAHAYKSYINIKNKDFINAKKNLDTADLYFNKVGLKNAIADIKIDRGELYAKKGDYNEALKYFADAYNYSEEKNLKTFSEIIESDVFEIILDGKVDKNTSKRINENFQTDSLLKKNYKVLQRNPTLSKENKIYDLFIKYYTNLKLMDSIVKYQQLKLKVLDELKEKELLNNAEVIEEKNKNFQVAQSIDVLKGKDKVQKAYLFIVIGLLALISVFLFFRQKKKNKSNKNLASENFEKTKNLHQKIKEEQLSKTQLEKEIEKRDKILLNKEIEIQKREALLKDIQEKLNTERSIAAIESSFKTHGHIENRKASLQEIFKNVNSDFVDRLTATHNLTKTDINYCILIYLGYSTSDIAHILKISSKAVSQHKYRLKKKLDLGSKQHIKHYLVRNFNGKSD